jgi:hypothetical protein
MWWLLDSMCLQSTLHKHHPNINYWPKSLGGWRAAYNSLTRTLCSTISSKTALGGWEDKPIVVTLEKKTIQVRESLNEDVTHQRFTELGRIQTRKTLNSIHFKHGGHSYLLAKVYTIHSVKTWPNSISYQCANKKKGNSLQFTVDILSTKKSWSHEGHLNCMVSASHSPAVYDPLLRSRYVRVESLYVRQGGEVLFLPGLCRLPLDH